MADAHCMLRWVSSSTQLSCVGLGILFQVWRGEGVRQEREATCAVATVASSKIAVFGCSARRQLLQLAIVRSLLRLTNLSRAALAPEQNTSDPTLVNRRRSWASGTGAVSQQTCISRPTLPSCFQTAKQVAPGFWAPGAPLAMACIEPLEPPNLRHTGFLGVSAA